MSSSIQTRWNVTESESCKGFSSINSHVNFRAPMAYVLQILPFS